MAVLPSPIHELEHPLLSEKQVQVFVKRDDLIHPEIMGNKWRKLKYNLLEAKERGFKKLVTMGGAYSNHIHATAAAAQEWGFQSVGIIRGEELTKDSNDTLRFASSRNMELTFVDREKYRTLREDPGLLSEKYPDAYLLPEGGTNELAIKGCRELVEEITIDFDVIALPIGTGGTFAGVIVGVSGNQHVLGVSSLKGSFIEDEIAAMLERYQAARKSYEITSDYHFGGYGKTTAELLNFINWFKKEFSIPLDPIYTGKSFFAVWDMIGNGKFEKNLRIILLHTGGLQGILGFNRKNQNIIQ